MNLNQVDPRLKRRFGLLDQERQAGAHPEELSSPGPADLPEVDLPEVDLASLLAEMAALKAEVRAETRSARDLREALARSNEALAVELSQARARQTTLQEQVRSERKVASRQVVRLVIDLLDRLDPALAQARAMARLRWGWLGRRRAPAAVALADGLDLTLARLRDTLSREEVVRVGEEGRPFDPKTMEVVDVEARAGCEDGTVVGVVTVGYRGPAGLLRPAQVVVSRKARSGVDR